MASMSDWKSENDGSIPSLGNVRFRSTDLSVVKQ